MDVRFRNRRLARCFERESEAVRAFGPTVGRLYRQRVILIRNSRTFESLFTYRHLRLHPLTGDRRGLYAMNITGPWRLVLSVDNDTVIFEEVSNHYDD